MPTVNPTYIAGNSIPPCRIVTMRALLDGATTTPLPVDFTVWLATVGATCVGISQEGTHDWDDTNAAAAGEQIRIFGPGEVCLLEIVATVTPGQYLKADATGKGTPTSTALDNVVGFALQGGSAGDKIQVYVHPVAL